MLTRWKDIAAYLGVSTKTAARWSKLEGCPIVKIGGLRMALEEDLDRWLDNETMNIKGSKEKKEKINVEKKLPYGYVYIIKSACPNAYKIGMTRGSPLVRMSAVQCFAPCKLEMIKVFKCHNCKETEAELHEKYKQQKIRGEWFRLSECDIEDIRIYFEKKIENVGL